MINQSSERKQSYQVGWQVLRSVTTVVNTIFFKRPFALRIRRGTCCIRGCTLIMISGWYFIIPFATSLYTEKQIIWCKFWQYANNCYFLTRLSQKLNYIYQNSLGVHVQISSCNELFSVPPLIWDGADTEGASNGVHFSSAFLSQIIIHVSRWYWFGTEKLEKQYAAQLRIFFHATPSKWQNEKRGKKNHFAKICKVVAVWDTSMGCILQ